MHVFNNIYPFCDHYLFLFYCIYLFLSSTAFFVERFSLIGNKFKLYVTESETTFIVS